MTCVSKASETAVQNGPLPDQLAKAPAEQTKPEEPEPEAGKAAREESRPAAGQAALRWPGWSALRDQLKSAMDVGDFVFLGNSAMVEGGWDGRELTLWACNDFIRDRVNQPAVTGAVARMAQRLMGGPVRVAVRVGKAPADGPKDAVPAEEEPDALEAFLSGSQGNVTVD